MGMLFDDDPDEPCDGDRCRGHYRKVDEKPCTMRPNRQAVTVRCDHCGDEKKFVRRTMETAHA
ncbi:MAG: hypothetical protein HY420_00455 [Candidatus Kerfeldbacteria bacterium]|nr:hypothetical protein [Candidatus Kerfeldbacteria bacterium]